MFVAAFAPQAAAGKDYFIRNASFFSFRAFISSPIHHGMAPRPAQVSFGSFLLRYFGATLWYFNGLPRRRSQLLRGHDGFAEAPDMAMSFANCCPRVLAPRRARR
jgi:hypothetical protein